MSKVIGAVIAVIVVVVACCCGFGLVPMFLLTASASPCGGSVPDSTAGPGASGNWNAEQMRNATIIVAVGKQMKVPARGIVIALATAMQESTLHNYSGGDRDSIGLFQQRPSMGWGTPAQIATPSYAAGKFYSALLKVNGWQVMSVTGAAQAVQRSAFPNAYAKWQDDAEKLAAQLMGVADITDIGGGDPGVECGLDGLGPVPVGPGGWVVPVKVPKIFSPFGPRGGRLHAGVDLSPPMGTPVRAASAGVVLVAKCNTNTGRCVGPTASGYGWMVEIRHPGNIVTRYGHMRDRPAVAVGQRVEAGQVIGFVGNTGHSTGPHLHFEVHTPVPPNGAVNNSNAINPVGFMKAAGAPLPPCCY